MTDINALNILFFFHLFHYFAFGCQVKLSLMKWIVLFVILKFLHSVNLFFSPLSLVLQDEKLIGFHSYS